MSWEVLVPWRDLNPSFNNDTNIRHYQVSLHVRESKTVLDSGFQELGGFQSLKKDPEFRIPVVNGIPHSLSYIPDSKAQDSRFHKKHFPGVQIQETKISWIPESGFLKVMLHGTIRNDDF